MKVVLDAGAYMPTRGHEDDAGLDLKTPVDVSIKAGGSVSIDTGVHIEIPRNYFGKLESKSGLNVKHSVVSHGGVIDSGYTGSIVVKLYNHGDQDYHFHAGDKIVQLIIQPCLIDDLAEVSLLEDTERGADGFGSTGR